METAIPEVKKRKLNYQESFSCSSKCSSNCILISNLIERLKTIFEKSTPENQSILELLGSFKYNPEDWKSVIHFSKSRYTRNLIALHEKFSMFVICWEGGQESPIHDHADRTAWVRILDGELEHIQYNASRKALKRSLISQGECIVFDNSVGLHKTSNSSIDKRVISLHVYSPPYIECGSQNSLVPATYCSIVQQTAWKEQEQLKFNRAIFSNFQSLTEILRKEIGEKPNSSTIARVKEIIANFHLNPKEWSQYTKWDQTHYTRNLVAYDEHFTLLLLCWDYNQLSPIHDHSGSSCWVKVLEGALTEILYRIDPETNKLKEFSHSTLLPDSVAYIDDSIGVHLMGNSSFTQRTITLHCYAPPYHKCFKYDLEGAKQCIDMRVVNQIPISEGLSSSVILPSIESLVSALNKEFAEKKPIEKDKLQSILNGFQFNANEWKQFAHFDPRRYTRNLLAFNSDYSLIMICWHKGQKSPLHTHNSSRSWVKVLHGELAVSEYNPVNHQIRRKSTLLSSTTSFFDSTFGPHITENGNKESNTISLHLYSPPYLECSSEEAIIPVVYCSGSQQISAITMNSQTEKLPDPINDLGLQLKYHKMVFMNFQSLIDVLRKEFSEGDSSLEVISSILQAVQVHPKEWKQYSSFDKTHYTRNLIASDKNFTLFLLCWNPEQSSTIHDHLDSSAWIKVLEGEIEESVYDLVNDKLCLNRRSSLLVDSVISSDSSIIHKLTNTSKTQQSITLHLFSPPFSECGCYDPDTSSKKLISVEEIQL